MLTNSLYQEVSNTALHHGEAYELARQDLDFFAMLALPLVTEYTYPETYHIIWELLRDYAMRTRDFSKLAIGFPRGFAKTSLIKLAVLWFILFSNKTHIAVVCSTATHAQNIISDIADMLDEPNVSTLFGDWRVGLEKDTQEQKRFGFRGRNIVLTAIGQGGSVRGLNIKHQRPDVMIFDDIQTREDADSKEVSDKIEQWMLGTAMKAASHKGCLYIFLANMYPTPHSILRKLKHNVEWVKFIVGGILADGTSLWEDLKPIKQLLSEYRNDANSGHPEIFYAEVLNDETANANNNIDISKIPTYPFGDDEISAGNFIIIDPSNDKVNSDAVTISVNSIIAGKPVVMELDEGRYSPEDTIKRALQAAMKHGASLICIEANAYQYSLKFWMDKYRMRLGLYELRIEPIYSGSRSKNSRILDMFKSLLTGEIIIHPRAWPLAAAQIVAFNALKTNNVDGILDCITYVPKVLTEFSHLITINSFATVNETLGVMSEEENCAF